MARKLLFAAIGLLGLIGIITLDHWYQSNWRKEKLAELRSTAQICRIHLENCISGRFGAIEAIAALFKSHPETSQPQFSDYAANLMEAYPPIRALQFADNRTQVIRVFPIQGNDAVVNHPMQLITDPLRGPYVRKAIAQKRATLQGPFELRQGGMGVVVRQPLFKGDNFLGLAIGVFDIPVLIDESLSGIGMDAFNICLNDSQGRLFFGSKALNETFVKEPIHLADTHWSLILNWKPEFYHPPVLIQVLIWVLGIGFIVSVMFIVRQAWQQNVRLSNLINDRTEDLMQANDILTREIAEHKQTAQSLIESETKYRSMMEALSDSVYICSKDFTVEYMNPAMIKRIGRDATGERCYEALYDRNAKCPWCVHHYVQEGQAMEINLTSPKDNRTYRITHLPIPHENGDISKLTLFRDITDYLTAVAEKDKAAAQLQQAQKMEAIGTLAGGIAHDFNNILSSVIGFTELSLDEVQPGSLIQQNLLEVLTAGHRARDLVKQILTFARKSDTELKPVQVNLIAKEALKLLRSTLPATIEIQEEIKSDSLVMGNIIQIHQIFLNLGTNAAHAMEEKGGVLKVKLEDVSLDNSFAQVPGNLKSGDYLKISVSDNGTGISPTVLPNIFEPYFTTKPTGEGTGMGLAMVHGIVKSYGGEITVESSLGKGSVFTVCLPVCMKRSAGVTVYETEDLKTGHERIMLVDDELPIIQIINRSLELLGYKVTAHTSSSEALSDFKSRPKFFDLVITDMTMPYMTGERLALEMMDIRPDIPIILCTGYSKKIDEAAAYKLGIKAFIMKPIVKNALASTIRRVLDGAMVQ